LKDMKNMKRSWEELSERTFGKIFPRPKKSSSCTSMSFKVIP
jgi:hypothetical protein